MNTQVEFIPEYPYKYTKCWRGVHFLLVWAIRLDRSSTDTRHWNGYGRCSFIVEHGLVDYIHGKYSSTESKCQVVWVMAFYKWKLTAATRYSGTLEYNHLGDLLTNPLGKEWCRRHTYWKINCLKTQQQAKHLLSPLRKQSHCQARIPPGLIKTVALF